MFKLSNEAILELIKFDDPTAKICSSFGYNLRRGENDDVRKEISRVLDKFDNRVSRKYQASNRKKSMASFLVDLEESDSHAAWREGLVSFPSSIADLPPQVCNNMAGAERRPFATLGTKQKKRRVLESNILSYDFDMIMYGIISQQNIAIFAT